MLNLAAIEAMVCSMWMADGCYFVCKLSLALDKNTHNWIQRARPDLPLSVSPLFRTLTSTGAVVWFPFSSTVYSNWKQWLCCWVLHLVWYVLFADMAVLPLRTQLPLPCSLETAALHYFDFQSIPSRYFFKLLSYFAKSPMEKERLEEFASAEGQVSRSALRPDLLFCQGVFISVVPHFSLSDLLVSFTYKPNNHVPDCWKQASVKREYVQVHLCSTSWPWSSKPMQTYDLVCPQCPYCQSCLISYSIMNFSGAYFADLFLSQLFFWPVVPVTATPTCHQVLETALAQFWLHANWKLCLNPGAFLSASAIGW